MKQDERRGYDDGLRAALLRTAALAVVFTVLDGRAAAAQERPEFRVERLPTPPKIDGVLDDAAWSGSPLALGAWLSYEPLRGDTGPERTEVRVGYDDRYIYFAFNCLSDDPSTIRTTVSRRDSVFNDDWVGLSLDSTDTGQTAYHLMVNPNGIQMDAVNTTAAGERFESDFLWYSAGKRTASGYIVEMAIPVQTIRFSRTSNVTMGILFWRHVSRSGVSYSWPDMPPGQWVFNRHARLIFPDLIPRRVVELLPSATLPLSQTRATPERWNGLDGRPDFGVSAKYGVTSQVTLDATVNPDFSQVESDAFQVQVNQRFPTFFSEKRPFFMEGIGLFNVAGTGGDFNMRSAVHTRRIVNPAWGAKLTGTAGRLSFGVLDASDETPEDIGDRGAAVAGRNTLFTIARASYGIGGSDYVGAIVTDTEHAGRHNRVVGSDISWKPTPSQGMSATYLASNTAIDGGTSTGSAAQVSYSYDTRRTFVATQLEHYDGGFQMDTAFYNRTGFTSAFMYGEVNFYPKTAKRIGLIRVHPLVVLRRGEDRLQGGGEGFVLVGAAFNFNRQGFLRIQHGEGHEPWAGRRFRSGDPVGVFGSVQLFRWLKVGANFFHAGWATFYDPVDPYQGRSTTGGFDVTWQPNEHFSQNASYSTVRFDRADSGARVFSVDIVNAKTVYQFDSHFLVRLLEQFDSSRHQLLTDLLASYEFVPGTVLHAGYGSLYEQRELAEGHYVPNSGKYFTVSRGLFFKASYLYRF
jgi:hypothetical protein